MNIDIASPNNKQRKNKRKKKIQNNFKKRKKKKKKVAHPMMRTSTHLTLCGWMHTNTRKHWQNDAQMSPSLPSCYIFPYTFTSPLLASSGITQAFFSLLQIFPFQLSSVVSCSCTTTTTTPSFPWNLISKLFYLFVLLHAKLLLRIDFKLVLFLHPCITPTHSFLKKLSLQCASTTQYKE